MKDSVNLWLYLYAHKGESVAQIARLFGTYHNKVKRALLAEYRRVLAKSGYKQLTTGKVKRLFKTADAGLILAYHQCSRCASHNIKLIYEAGVPEGVRCGRCGVELSLLPSAFSLRR